jgi:hypothetical protein
MEMSYRRANGRNLRFIVCLLSASLWASTVDAVSTLNLAWQDNSNNEDGFNIERATSILGPFSKISVVGPNVTTYRDTNLPEVTNFCYRVSAFNAAGVLFSTNVICAVTKATPTFGEPSAGTAGSFLTGGVETSGLVRGPAFQLFNNSGVLQTTQFALNPDFREVTFRLGNFDADAAEEILVGGRETTGLMRGSAYQIFDPDGTLKLTRLS